MQVQRVITQRGAIDLGRNGVASGNFVDVITGPNGCGKTELLDVLLQDAIELRPSPNSQRKIWPVVYSKGTPNKVVVQTFSPFSRFAVPRVDRTSLTKRYIEEEVEQEKYVCVGLHKASRSVGAGLARKVLEEALFRLSENPKTVDILFSVLSELGFQTQFSLGYRPKPTFVKLFDDDANGQGLEAYLGDLQSRNYHPSFARLFQEFNLDYGKSFLDLLRHSLDIVRGHREYRRKSYRLPISLQNVRSEFHTIQAFALLRRLGLLILTSCELATNNFDSIDVAKTSSGQQQMLCAIFGLSTSISNGCLVLLDEPELSLHPEWQLKFVDALFRILYSVQDAHVIMATHSPLVVQQAVQHGADVVQMGDSASRSVVSSHTFSGTSMSVEQTLVDVFRTPVSDSAHVSNEIFQAVLKGETGSTADKEEALATLKQLDEIYRSKRGGKTASLVRDAIQLINTPDDLPASIDELISDE